MSGNADEKTRVGVLVDPDHAPKIEDASWRAEDAVVEVTDDVGKGLSTLLAREPEVLVVGGNDAFVGRLLATYEFGRDLKRHALRLHPADVGGAATLARELGAAELSPKLVRRFVKATRSGRLQRRCVSTLKAVVSSEASARLGFSFGAGLFYRLFEAFKRARTETSARVTGTLLGLAKDTLLEGGRNLEPVKAKISCDGEPLAEEVGYLVCSSLSKTWLGLSMNTGEQGAAYRIGDRGRQLIKKVASSRALPSFVRSDEAVGFERMDIDWSSGFVLDGELIEPRGAHALRVEPGPTVECVEL